MNKEIIGIMVYYYKVCPRKLWYFYHEIQMENENEDVQLGKALDEQSYKNDEKHININNVINIDFIKKTGILHEIKKSKKIEEASVLQVKYYLYYLEKHGVHDITAQLDYPLLKQTIQIKLTKEDVDELESVIDDVRYIVELPYPLHLKKKSICKACAYYDMCFI